MGNGAGGLRPPAPPQVPGSRLRRRICVYFDVRLRFELRNSQPQSVLRFFAFLVVRDFSG